MAASSGRSSARSGAIVMLIASSSTGFMDALTRTEVKENQDELDGKQSVSGQIAPRPDSGPLRRSLSER